MNRLFFLIIVLLTGKSAFSQYYFVERGRIIFERKVNTHAILPEVIGESGIVAKEEFVTFFQKYKADHPQFWIDSFQLIFDHDSTLYKPVGSISPFLHGIGVPMADRNQVLTDLSSFQYFAGKNAYDEQKVIRDTLTKIRWKLTDEIREIAGFECRRANALINDSIYIVAFYTDAIKTRGGPELFNGLPGMILGLAIPHYHISYFATRFEALSKSEKMTTPNFLFQKSKIKQIDYFDGMLNYLKDKNLDSPWMKVFIRL